MITVTFLFIFLVFLTYRHKSLKKDLNKPFYYRYRKILVLLAITIFPVLLMNLFHTGPRKVSLKEHLEYTKDRGRFYSQEEAYQAMMISNPENLKIRLEYIDLVMDWPYYDQDKLIEKQFSPIKIIQFQSRAYLKAKYFQKDSNWISVQLPALDSKIKFDNYILGLDAKAKHDFAAAKTFFHRGTKYNPDFDNNYLELIELCRYNYPEEFDKYSLNPKYASHLPYSTQRFNYFWHGDYYNYFKVITIKTFANIEVMALIAALLISIFWLIFMRSMDVYNTEKWRDIIIVFILGALFTHLCLFGYDYFRYIHKFTINHEAWNDFWYCTIVIGASEEIVKLIPWVAFIFLAKKAKEPYDYILYASVAALGFSFVENFSYLENPGNIVIRTIMSTVGHMFDASVIAYSFILSRYKTKHLLMKIAWPFIGFVLACLSHGFYDFWLISGSVSGYEILTTVFFVFTLSIWFLMHNNAINNSPFFTKSLFNIEVQLNVLTFGIISLMMVEYVLIGYRYGAGEANQRAGIDGWIAIIFLSYLTLILSRVKIIPGIWKKYKFVMPTGFGSYFSFTAPSRFQVGEDAVESHLGLHLKLFVSKSNRYVSDKFPVSGRCVETMELSQSSGWYLFQLNNPINFPGYKGDQVIIRLKDKNESLEVDKVEIILLFIPVGIDPHGSHLVVEDFRYTGKAFSRPD